MAPCRMTRTDRRRRGARSGAVWAGCGGLLLAAGAGALIAARPARAQQGLLLDQFINPNVPGYDTAPGVTVGSRARPEYAFQGVRLGGFVIRPELTETAGYSSNVTGTRRGRGSALIQTAAGVQARSDWSRHSLGASIGVDDTRFLDVPGQSFTNWTASVGGTYDIGRDTVSLAATHQNLNLTPRDLDTAQVDRVVPFRIDSVRAGYRAAFNRLSLRPELDVSAYDYDDGSAGGRAYVQSYRNRVVVSPGVTAGYELSPRRNLVLVLRDSSASYSNGPPGAPRRDFNDVAALAGVDFEAGGALRYRVLAGYQARFFSGAAYKTIAAPVVEAAAIWTPTGLTTVTASVARRIQDSADETTAGFTGTGVQLRVDHEYLRNVLLRASAGFFRNEYGRNQGQQTLYTAGAGATWLLNRNMRLAATYDFATRETSGTGNLGPGQRFGSGYSESRYLLQLRLAL